MDKIPFFALEGNIDAARELVETAGSELAELFVYPGDRHLFTDNSLRRTAQAIGLGASAAAAGRQVQ